MDQTGYREGVRVGYTCSTPLDVATADGKESGRFFYSTPLMVEPDRMSGRQIGKLEGQSRPQCFAACRVEVAEQCRTLEQIQTCTLSFRLPLAVCVRSVCRRAWHWLCLPGPRQGPPVWMILGASCAASTQDCQRLP